MKPWLPRLAVAALLAVLATKIYLEISRLRGRLAQELVFDDVAYAVDGAARLQSLLDGGPAAFLRGLAAVPPHSPYQSLLAVGGFLIGGLDEGSMYAANGVLLVAAALWLSWSLREASTGIWAVALAALLTMPLAYFSINEARPDLAQGLATALMAWYFVTGVLQRTRISFVVAGLALGAALLVKPTFFAHTLAIAIALCGVALVAAAFDRPHGAPDSPDWRAAARPIVTFLGIGAALSCAYWVVAWRPIFEHFWTNTFGTQAVWWSMGAERTFAERVARAWQDQRSMNVYATPFAVLASLAFAAWLARSGVARRAGQLVAFLAIGLLSVAILFFGNHPSPYFFATAHWIAMLAAAHGLAMTGRTLAPAARRALTIAAGVCVALLFAFDAPLTFVAQVSNDVRKGIESNGAISRAIWEDLRRQGAVPEAFAAPPRVLVLVGGDVNYASLAWSSIRQGQPLNALGVSFEATAAQVFDEALSVDYVVVSNPVSANFRHDFPDAALQAAVVPRLMADARFRLMRPWGSEARYFLVANQARMAELPRGEVVRTDGFIVQLTGLRSPEGPYPQRSPPLPRLRWMSSPEASVCVADHAHHAQLSLEFFAAEPGTLSATHGRKQVGASLIAAGFGKVGWPVDIAEGPECTVLRFVPEHGAAKAGALFFSRVELASDR